jgi:ankyrin repeat protein
MMLASQVGDLETVKQLVAARANVNLADNFGNTALSFAVANAHRGVVAILLKTNADVNHRDVDGRTPLFWSVQLLEPETTAQLLDAGADLDVRDADGSSVFSLCSEQVAPLLSPFLARSVRNTESLAILNSALRRAAANGFSAFVQQLLLAGADPNAVDRDGESALVAAVRNGDLSVIAMLLEKGADPNATDSLGRTALAHAAEKGSVEAVRLLLQFGADVNKRGKGNSAWMSLKCAVPDSLSVLSLLLEHQEDVNRTESHGQTALMLYASGPCAQQIVPALLNMGSTVDLQDDRGNTALIQAATRSNGVDVVSLLLTRGANAETRNRTGQTALMIAAESGNAEAVSLLLARGLSANDRDNTGRTALMYASSRCRLSAAAALLHFDADVNVVDQEGNTALLLALKDVTRDHVAQRQLRLALLKLLLSAGAAVNISNNAKESPRLMVRELVSIEYDIGDRMALATLAPLAAPESIFDLVKRHGDAAIHDLERRESELRIADDSGRSVLMAAAALDGDDTTVLDFLLARRLRPNDKDRAGRTVLMYLAAGGCSSSKARSLLSAGADPDLQDAKGFTALMQLIESHSTSEECGRTALLLIDRMRRVDQTDNSGRTALMLAAAASRDPGEVRIVNALHSKINNVNSKDAAGASALLMAVRTAEYGANATAVAIALVKGGADVNLRGPGGTTPLLAALTGGPLSASDEIDPAFSRSSLVRLLVENGANVNLSDDTGLTPLMAAAMNETPATGRAESLISPRLRLLLSRGANVNAVDKDGRTALMLASSAFPGSVACVKALLEHKATVNVADLQGQTPLMFAAHAERPGATTLLDTGLDRVRLLLDAGANIQARDKRGRSPVAWAAESHYGDIRIAKELLSDRDGYEQDDLSGRTLLMKAITRDDDELMDFLLSSRRVAVNAVDGGHATALLVLARSSVTGWTISEERAAARIEALIAHGADPDISDRDGRTPLMYFAQYSYRGSRFIQSLISHGSNVEARDHSGKTALMYAVENAAHSVEDRFHDAAENIRVLVTANARVDAQDGTGRSVMEYANGDGKVIEMLTSQRGR